MKTLATASSALRNFIRSRKFRGFGLLLLYCHMLMLFAFMGRLCLPGLTDLAVAVGVSQAWRTTEVQSALEIINSSRSGIDAIKTEAADWLKYVLPGKIAERFAGGTENAHETRAPEPDEAPPGSAVPEPPDQLPELTTISGIILAEKISSALVPIMFLLTMISLLGHFFFKISLWLGLGHALLCAILFGRAGLALASAPELYRACLTTKLQNFANGGCLIWLAALLTLCALLAATARAGRKAKN